MDGNNSMVSLAIKVKQDISDLEFRWLKAQTHIVNIVTGSHFFIPFFLLRFDGNTLARPFTPLSISAANIHFPKCGAAWELFSWHDPCVIKKENLLDSLSIHRKVRPFNLRTIFLLQHNNKETVLCLAWLTFFSDLLKDVETPKSAPLLCWSAAFYFFILKVICCFLTMVKKLLSALRRQDGISGLILQDAFKSN